MLPRTKFKVHTGGNIRLASPQYRSGTLVPFTHNDRIAAQDMSCVKVFEMTSPEIDKRNEKMGLNKAQI